MKPLKEDNNINQSNINQDKPNEINVNMVLEEQKETNDKEDILDFFVGR